MLLIPKYGIHGAAIATMLSIFLYNLIKYIFVWVRFSMQPFTRDYFWLILLAMISLGIVWLLPEFRLVPNLIVTTAIVSLTLLLPVWWLGLSSDLNRMVNRLLDQVRSGD